MDKFNKPAKRSKTIENPLILVYGLIFLAIGFGIFIYYFTQTEGVDAVITSSYERMCYAKGGDVPGKSHTLTYIVNGKSYTKKLVCEEGAAQVGDTIKLRYNKSNPENATKTRVFVVIGIASFVFAVLLLHPKFPDFILRHR
ncbi:MAG: hypothetical protein K6A44_04400 [bacterium]|nr:hypothetical protein [bacterium]